MDRMMYVAMSGAKEILLSQANNSHNLANVNTPGFMEDLSQFRSMPVHGQGHPTRVYAMNERPAVSFDEGKLQSTGNTMDVAVKGNGYLAVQSLDGTEAYTRRGDLKVDTNGIVTNGEGLPVIGNGGPIALPPHEKIDIGADGTITVLPVGATPETLAIIDRIKLVNPPVGDLVKGEDGLMRLKDASDAPAEAATELVSGAIESSNVNVADALVNMIELSRKFELQVKMMKTAQELDSSTAKLMQQN